MSKTTTEISAPFVNAISELAKKTVSADGKAKFLSIPGEPTKSLLVKSSGETEVRDHTATPRSHSLLTINDLCEYPLETATVYVREEQVVAVLDDSEGSLRLDSVRVPLTHSDAWAFLADPRQLDQKQFLRVLRTKLFDCFDEEFFDTFCKQISALDFTNIQGGTSTVTNSKATIDRSIEQEVRVQNGGPLPDRLRLSVRTFNDPSLKMARTIECALETEPGAPVFTVVPLAGQLRDALDADLAFIKERIGKSTERPVYLGRP